MGIQCSKCTISQSDKPILLYDEYSCHYHIYGDNDKVCQDCLRNPMTYSGNCRHMFRYQLCGIFCCYA